MPKTCWVADKCQDNKLENLSHLGGELFELNHNQFKKEDKREKTITFFFKFLQNSLIMVHCELNMYMYLIVI
jgi:hypothetical protein